MSLTETAVGLAAAGGGAKPAATLQRTLRARHVEMIAIGGIIGAGLFVGSSSAIATVGPAVVLSYAAAGFVVLLVMRMLSEMAMAQPGIQSFAEFARLGLGDWAGFLSGWLYWYFWVVAIAIEAIAGATIVHAWIPTMDMGLIAVLLTGVLTGVNLLSTRSFGEFEFWFSSIKVAAILVFIIVAFAFVTGMMPTEGPGVTHLFAHGGFMPNGALAILGGATSVIFSLVGAEIATIAAAEAAESEATVARMTGTVATRILIFYIVSVALIVACVPWSSIVPGYSPFTAALDAIQIPGGAFVMNVIVLVAVLSCLNSGLYVTSRVLFSLAAKGDAPGWVVVTDRRQVPTRAILFGSMFSYLTLGIALASPHGMFAFLVNSSGAIMIVIYLMIACSQLRLRSRLERESPGLLRIRMWLHPWASLFAIAAMVAVLAAMAVIPSLASQFFASLLAVVVAAIAYGLSRLWRSRLDSPFREWQRPGRPAGG